MVANIWWLPSCTAWKFETKSQRMGAVPQHKEGPHASPSSSHREVCPGTRLVSSINVLCSSEYRGNTFNLSLLNMMSPLCLLYMAFIMPKYVSSITTLFFIINGCWVLSYVLSASIEMIMWFLFFNLLMWYISHWLVFCCCSVAQSCPTLCNPMDCSTVGLPVLHHLPEPAQTHVQTESVMPSNHLALCCPLLSSTFNLSQHHGLF